MINPGVLSKDIEPILDDMGATENYGQTEFSPVITQTTSDDAIEKRVAL